MHIHYSILVLIIFIKNAKANRYGDLPELFRIDDYEQCKKDNKLFCNVDVILSKSNQRETKHWKIIEDSINDSKSYNHNELFHAICLEDFCPGNKFNLNFTNKELSECYSQKYKELGLKAEAKIHTCLKSDREVSIGYFDVIYLIVVISYIIYVIVISCVDYYYKDLLPYHINEFLVKPFSLERNLEKLRQENSSKNFQKLKCMQGIRFYNMLLIIFCHTFCSYVGGYVLNPDYFEEIENNVLKLCLRNLLVFLVQSFFLFSAFLLSYHTFQMMQTTVFNKRYLFLTFLNRYLRIIPPVVVMIATGCTTWLLMVYNGPLQELYSDLEYKMCRKNWWSSLLLIGNHYNEQEMCFFTLWYLDADTQLYILSLIILGFIWKYQKYTKHILIGSIVVGVLIPIIVSYIHNVDIIYRITPENVKNNRFRTFKFSVIYFSTYVNMPTYMIGLYVGYIYFKYGNGDLFKKNLYKILWLPVFLGLPLLVISIALYQYSRLISAILVGILKPTFAIGIAIGVLGMSQKLGGVVRKICEWKFAVFMGNFTYTTYLINYGIVFYRTATARQPLYVSDFVMLKSFISDVLLSFIFGLITHVLIEIPAYKLQNLLVPQTRNQRQIIASHKKKH